ncbi:MAG: ribosomal protein S18-alanine N-acetyltransferase [Chloroflexi bacterium]|nr:ribosomal protein S18-alanine N-acetyltransferase [Chloroflexota bacterium]
MKALERQPETKAMPFAVRPLAEGDIAQSAEIEREAFPALFPPTQFKRELKNRRSRYLVAWLQDHALAPWSSAPESEEEPRRPLFGRLLRTATSRWLGRPSAWEPGSEYIVGFLGIWYSVDEAHVVSVGVRQTYRGQGIGELLLIAAIEQAMARPVEVVTLEVRVSNQVAKRLYSKYGFTERGLRKGYYTDNREDALIMTTESINLPPFSELFRELVGAHEERWGRARRSLA